MTDRELLQMALDALELTGVEYLTSKEIEHLDALEIALRARLAQPENKFNPDWDAMAVMVEEQQRMAKRVEELEAQLAQPEPVIYARKEGDLIVVDLPQVPTGGGGISKNEQPELTRKWVGLTDEELEFYTEELGQGELGRGVLRAVVDFLKEKNT
jgi:hypothetical protein